MNSPLGRAVQRTIAQNALILKDLPGKAWNGPNTAIGLAYGLAGHVAGELNRLRPGDRPVPKISLGHNAVEFRNNPFGGVSAITLGNASIYADDPYDPQNPSWDNQKRTEGHSPQEHEEQHTYQGQQLGPLYLPSNLLGGLNSVLRGEGWHGEHNWNERGPQSNPPTPWARKITR